MDRDTAVSQIKFNLRNRQGTDLDAQIVLHLQQAQRLLEMGRSLPYFLKEEDATLTVTSGTADIAFPTGFLREIDDEAFHRLGTGSEASTMIYLEKMDLRNAQVTFADSDAGPPIAYAIRRAGWSFFPERDTSYDLTYSYFKSGTALTSNVSDNAWLVNAPDILIGRAGRRIAEILGDDKAVAFFGDLFTAAWNGVFAESVMREEENKPLNMGSRNL